jgi:hypothetical protein
MGSAIDEALAEIKARKLQPVRIGPGSASAIGIMMPLAFIWKGYLTTWIWLWFMVPLGVPSISIPMAVGLNLLAQYILPKPTTNDVTWDKGTGLKVKPEWAEAPAFSFFGVAFIGPVPVFGVSWLVSLWLP